MRAAHAAVLAMALAVAGGCQTADRAAYQAALERDEAGSAETEERQETPAATHPDSETRPAQSGQPYYDRFDIETVEPAERPENPNGIEAGLWLAVDRAERKARTSGSRIADPALNAYLHGITCRLAPEYCNDFRTYIMRVPAFNASMAPNGMMTIWSGLLIRAESEAQVAAVIGHEIGHYLRRHSLQRHRDLIERTDGHFAMAMFAGLLGVPSLADLAGQIAVLGQYAFSREHEREADGWGAVLMAKAGYDPGEAPKTWEYILAEYEAMGIEPRESARSTHPPSRERADALRELAAQLRERYQDADFVGRARFLDNLWRFRRSFLEDEVQVGNEVQAHLLIDRMIENGEDLPAAHFYRGELYRLIGARKPHADDEDAMEAYEAMEAEDRKQAALADALESYRASIAADGRPAMPRAHRSMGVVLKKLDRPEEARDAFAKYLERAPDAEDRPLIEMMISGAMS